MQVTEGSSERKEDEGAGPVQNGEQPAADTVLKQIFKTKQRVQYSKSPHSHSHSEYRKGLDPYHTPHAEQPEPKRNTPISPSTILLSSYSKQSEGAATNDPHVRQTKGVHTASQRLSVCEFQRTLHCFPQPDPTHFRPSSTITNLITVATFTEDALVNYYIQSPEETPECSTTTTVSF